MVNDVHSAQWIRIEYSFVVNYLGLNEKDRALESEWWGKWEIILFFSRYHIEAIEYSMIFVCGRKMNENVEMGDDRATHIYMYNNV